MYAISKRILDILIAGITLLLLSPLFLIIVILLKLTGEGEVFYLQNRIGLYNKDFKIYKFATMLKNSMKMGTGSITLRNDPRVTSVGKYLRITKLNEMPQILNVLIGNMSIVGPRPLVTKTFDAYPEQVQKVVYNHKPGITGLGSIVFRDEEELISSSNEDPHTFYEEKVAPYKGELELYYQKKASLWTDIKIIFLTAWYIIFSKSTLLQTLFKDLPERPKHLTTNK